MISLRRAGVVGLEIVLAFTPLLWGAHHYFSAAKIPGDLGDARFNMYVLEHGFLWLSGRDSSFWSAPFFFPAKDVIAYSDNLLGSLPLYAFFRWFHYGRESSFQLWIVVSFFLNYGASYWVMRKWGLPFFGAVSGSYVFTFALPVMGQVGHAQLFARFMVPVGFYYWLKFLEGRRLGDWSISLMALLWQVYLGIYTGYFLGMAYALTLVSRWLLLQSYEVPNETIKIRSRFIICRAIADIRHFFAILRKSKTRPFLLSFGSFVLGLVPLAIPYGTVALEMGGRSWNEISSMLPRLSSYFRAPQSIFYGKFFHWGDDLPLPWEHMIFVGIIPFVCLTAFPFWIRTRRLSEPKVMTLRIAWGALLIFFVLTFEIGKLSMYWFLALLPGGDAIRAVTRYMLVMIFPVAFIMGALLSSFLEQFQSLFPFRKSVGSMIFFYLAAIASIVFVVGDQVSDFPSYSKQATLDRVGLMKAQMIDSMKINGVVSSQVVVWVNQNNSQFFQRQIDAMLAAQELGIPTINGYSGNVPKGYPGDLFYLSKGKCNGLKQWMSFHKQDFSGKTLLVIGDPCPNMEAIKL